MKVLNESQYVELLKEAEAIGNADVLDTVMAYAHALGRCNGMGKNMRFALMALSRQCDHPACKEHAYTVCDNCDADFCSEHGSPGGDREGGTNADGSPYGAYAVPAVCWKCGGYNADE